MNARSKHTVLPFIAKNGVLMLISASLIWFFTLYVLAPVGLLFLMPFATLVSVYFFELALRLLFPQEGEKQVRERLFSCGMVIFAVYHAFDYSELIVILVSACLGMIIWSFVLYAVKCRVDESTISSQWKNAPLLLISMGMIGLALYAWDGAWLML